MRDDSAHRAIEPTAQEYTSEAQHGEKITDCKTL